MATHDAVVVGAGVAGLSAALSLASRGPGKVAVAERFGLGHVRGSSHGASRIFRSTYKHPELVALATEALAEDWPRLEAAAGERLLHPSPAFFFGPPEGDFAAYAAGVADHPGVERVSGEEAAKRFPTHRFHGVEGVLVDHTAHLVAAEATMAALTRLCEAAGVEFLEEWPVEEVCPREGPFLLRSPRGDLRAERVVVAPGAWASRLLPSDAPPLTVARQTVAFLGLEQGPTGLGEFPIWVWLGPGENGLYYGLPEFGSPGVKVARDIIVGRADNPDSIGDPDWVDMEEAMALASERFMSPVSGVEGTETCLYTMAPGEWPIIAPHPQEPRIVYGAGFSGHGFKFGPLLGRILADLAVDGTSSSPAFNAAAAHFSLRR